MDIINISLAFLEGFALIISPCILPILPIVLAGSLVGSKKRPLGIIVGFVITFALFTFFSRKLVQYSGIDLNFIRYFSYAILLLLAIVILSNKLTEKFSQFTQKFANTGLTLSFVNNPQGGFISGTLFGGLVAIIWTPCAGPILAAVIVQTVVQKTNIMSFLTLLAFAFGAAVPMLIIAFFGRSIITKFNFFKSHSLLWRKILGSIIILAVIFMITSEQKLPNLFAAPINQQSSNQPTLNHLQNSLLTSYPEPEISGITAWLNSAPLQLKDLRGKVVLIDFWTYSCINCIRTLPYLKDWYNKYHSAGLVIIGVHTPEFDFEKNLNNVKNAVEKFGIKYPVALDNQFVTWQNFNNAFWPAHYLINREGNVVYTHFGEGEYATTENNIRFLLGIKAPLSSNQAAEEPFSFTETPETYLGYERANSFASPEDVIHDQKTFYTLPKTLPLHNFALYGNWIIRPDRIIAAQDNAVLKIHFRARKVFMVMGSTTPTSIELLLNDKKVTSEKGKDVVNSYITVTAHRLYEAITLPQAQEGVLQITSSKPGLELYTFTFGE